MNDAEVDAMSQRYNRAIDAQRTEINSYRQSDAIIREENVKLRADLAAANLQVGELQNALENAAYSMQTDDCGGQHEDNDCMLCRQIRGFLVKAGRPLKRVEPVPKDLDALETKKFTRERDCSCGMKTFMKGLHKVGCPVRD